MPNPPALAKWPNVPLDKHLGYATHVTIKCGAITGSGRCGHTAIMMTSELYRLAPKAVTVSEFQHALRCKRCKGKGWAIISVAGRG